MASKGKRGKELYLDPEVFCAHLAEAKAKGVPTVQVCEDFRLIATHLLGDSRYRLYSPEMQQDLVSEALLYCLKGIKYYNPDRKDTTFALFTRRCEQAFWRFLAKHYQQINIRRALQERALQEWERTDPIGAQNLREKCQSAWDGGEEDPE